MKTLMFITTLLLSVNTVNAQENTQCEQYQIPISATYNISTGPKNEQQILKIIRTKNKIIYYLYLKMSKTGLKLVKM